MAAKKPGVRARRQEYKEYLASPYWRMVAAAVIARDGKRCTKCSDTKRLEVHHLSYAHRGSEHAHLQDLTTLCHKCHREHHKRVKNAQKARRHGGFQAPKTTKA